MAFRKPQSAAYRKAGGPGGGRFAGRELDRRTGGMSRLGDGLGAWLAARGMEPRRMLLEQLYKNWDIVLGEEISPLARPLGRRNTVLLIGCDDSCSMQELSFAVPEILERVNAFMNEEFFTRVELHLLMGRDGLSRVEITEVPERYVPPRPQKLGRLRLPEGSPVAACYEAYLRCFEKT